MQCCLFYSVLKGFDIFGTQVNLSYNKDNQFKTVFGGFMAMFCIVIVTVLCFSNISTLFAKTQVTFVQSTEYEIQPSTLQIGINTTMIAVKYDQTNFIGRPMFNITFEQRHYHRYPNSTVNQTKTPFRLEPCTLDHFTNLPSYSFNWTLAFQQQNISDYLCLPKNQSFQVGGVFNNDDFYFLKITMSKCVNSTNIPGNTTYPWNPVCESPSVTQASITQSSRIRFIISNNILNPEKPLGSLTSFLDSAIYNVQPSQMYTTANIYFNSQTLITDESIIPLPNTHSEQLISYKSSDTVQQNAVGSFSNFCEIYFQRSTYSTTAQKSYLKLDQVISYIGGFCQIFFLVSAFIVSKYNSIVLYNELANRLYDFDFQRSDKNIEDTSPLSSNLDKQSLQKNLQRKSQQNEYTKSKDNYTANLNQQSRKNVSQKQDKYTQQLTDHKQSQSQQQRNKLQDDQMNKQNISSDNPVVKNQVIQNESTDQTPYKEQNVLNVTIDMSNIKTPSNLKYNNIDTTDNSPFQSVSKSPLKKKKWSRQLDPSSIITNLEQKFQNNEQSNLNSLKSSQLNLFEQTSKNNVKVPENLNKEAHDKQTKGDSVFYVKQLNSCKATPLKIQKKEVLFADETPEVKKKSLIQSQHRGEDANQYLDKELKSLMERDRSLWVSIQYVLNELTCGKLFNTTEVKLFNKALAYVNEDLDVFTILDRQKEVEKMKKLLFDEDQQVLFNFFPKPVIKLSEDQTILSRKQLKSEDKTFVLDTKHSFKKLNLSFKQMGIVLKAVMKFKKGRRSGLSNYQRLFQHYQKLAKQSGSRDSQSVMNKKLIDLLGDEMKNIFEVANEMYQTDKRNHNQSKNQNYQQEQQPGYNFSVNNSPLKIQQTTKQNVGTMNTFQLTVNESNIYSLNDNETMTNHQDISILQRNDQEEDMENQLIVFSDQEDEEN